MRPALSQHQNQINALQKRNPFLYRNAFFLMNIDTTFLNKILAKIVNKNSGQPQWLRSVIPVLWKCEVRGSLEGRNYRPAWATFVFLQEKFNKMSTTEYKLSHMPPPRKIYSTYISLVQHLKIIQYLSNRLTKKNHIIISINAKMHLTKTQQLFMKRL